jgi:histidinol-phosphatase (PHP family)
MQATCARAVAIGLPALAFTEHVDLTPWALHGVRGLPQHYRGHVSADGRFLGAPLDVAAYLLEVDRCRHAFPGLRILSGIELSEGHWHPAPVAELLAAFDLDRVVVSVHALIDLDARPTGSAHVEVGDGYAQRQPVDVVLAYLAEVVRWPPAMPQSRCSATSTTP